MLPSLKATQLISLTSENNHLVTKGKNDVSEWKKEKRVTSLVVSTRWRPLIYSMSQLEDLVLPVSQFLGEFGDSEGH